MKHATSWCLALLAGSSALAQDPVVGPAPDGSHVVTTTQVIRPAGETIEIPGRPVDIALSPDAKTVYVKDNRGLIVIDESTWKIRQELKFDKVGSSMCGLAVSADGGRIYASTAESLVYEGSRDSAGAITWTRRLELPAAGGKGNSFPCGLALAPDGKTLYVCLSRNNTLGILDLESGQLRKEVRVGVAPYCVAISKDGKEAFVSNWGGRHPGPSERSATSAGTPALIDERGIAASGTLSIVNLEALEERVEVEVGLSPSAVLTDARTGQVLVTASNSDVVSCVDVATRVVSTKMLPVPDEVLPIGSMPNGLAMTPDSRTMFVCNAGNNAAAVFRRGLRGAFAERPIGFIPTGWYPGPVAATGSHVYIASIKGVGSRTPKDADGKKWKSAWHRGTISKVPIPDDPTLKAYTQQVMTDSKIAQVFKGRDESFDGGPPAPIPTSIGQRSLFEHVVYIIKENRTFDQVFGDMGRGNAEPSLCMYGREVTPNIHALADQFVLLDNFYCNGVVSADGHSWATEGNTTPYLERSFGGFNRSYTFGDDPLTYSSSGFVWDHVLAAGFSFRNYGEFNYAGIQPAGKYQQVYEDFVNKTGKYAFTHKIGVDRVREHSCLEYPGWNLEIPDVVRARVFLNELADFEKKGQLPNFMTVYLPNDHTNGTGEGHPTPRSYVADNDLALGRIVEGLTHSRFWSSTCIFVIEDDPQDGFDHVDGHRSTCLVISPYTKRGEVVSRFYSQASVVHTIERIFGCVPANQQYAMAPVMFDCFRPVPDLKPFECLPNKVPLAEMNKKAALRDLESRALAELSDTLDFSRPDQPHEDELNRILWHDARGPVPYPAEWAGAHGRGLAPLGLKLAGPSGPEPDDDDDD